MAQIAITVLLVFNIILFARVIFSWIPVGYDSPFRPVADAVYRITEPVLAPIRQVIPPLGGFDVSIIIVFLFLQLMIGVIS